MINKTAYKIIKFNYAALILMSLILIFPILTPNEQFKFERPVILADKFDFNESLQGDADALLGLFDNMPQIAVFVTDREILKSGTSIERGVAYTLCETSEKPVIFVKKSFYENTNRQQLVNILKHELTHAWLCRQNLMSGHDEIFRRKFAEVGGFGN